MSESAVEGLAGDTGEVVAPESTDSALEGHEEDQAAEFGLGAKGTFRFGRF